MKIMCRKAIPPIRVVCHDEERLAGVKQRGMIYSGNEEASERTAQSAPDCGSKESVGCGDASCLQHRGHCREDRDAGKQRIAKIAQRDGVIVRFTKMSRRCKQAGTRKSDGRKVAITAGIGVVCLGAVIWASQFWATRPTANARQVAPAPAHYKARVVAEYPHDEAAFTQGLLYHDGALFESTGQYGESTVRQVKLETGEVLQQREIAPEYFAEGLALHNGRLIQLTWKEGTAFVYDIETLNLLGTLTYSGEGWGLASNGTELFFTDGSDRIRVMDGNLRMLRRIEVRDGSGPVERLNEAEWYRGTLLVNVWGTDLLVQVDPSTGRVLAWVDCSGLLPAGERTQRTDVLNGIAYDEERNRLFVTGKYWPKLYQIELAKE